MFTVSAQDLSDLFASIDLGLAKEVVAARHWVDATSHMFRFFHIDGRVFHEDYNDGSAKFFEVVGEDLDLFKIYYPEVSK